LSKLRVVNGDCPIAPSILFTADSSVSRSIVVEAI
jgi:hypothetical protein